MIHPKPQRSFRGNPVTTRNMFFLSLLLHLIVIALAMISISTPSRPLTFSGTYSVSLVSAEAVMTSRQLPGLQDIMRPSPAAGGVIVKREIDTSRQTTIKKAQDGPAPDIAKAISAIRQKQITAAHPAPEKQDSQPASAYGGQTGPGAADASHLAEYSAFVQARIKSNWSLPDALRPATNTLTIIEIRIARDGNPEYIGFEKRSGNSYYDESALRAVKKSAPFPPLPEAYKRNSIEIGIRFPSSELK
ncbi:MAG: TonB family protein [Smithellaceae bacterium]